MRCSSLMMLIWALSPAFLQAHGIALRLEPHEHDLVVYCSYSDSSPAIAVVSIYSPVNPEQAYETLETDAQGRASFTVAVAGEWKVIADDGTGHRVVMDVRVNPGVMPQVIRNRNGMNGLAFGVVLLLLLGLGYGQLSKHKRAA